MRLHNAEYEWTVERFDGEDIVDVDHTESYADALRGVEGEPDSRIGLTLTYGHRCEERVWAYLKDGKLPATFSDAYQRDTGIPVPRRFIKEAQA